MKKVLSWLLIISIVCTFSPYAIAADTESVQPRYAYISTIYIDFAISANGLAEYTAKITTIDYHQTKMECKLQRYSNGDWTTVYSWSGTGVGRTTLNRQYMVYSGEYRIVVTGTIYDDNNRVIEIASKASNCYSYSG